MPIFVARDLDVEAAATEFMLPVMDGMEAIHFLNGTVEKAAHNYAPGKQNAVVKGTPNALTSYTKFKGNENYLETRIQESAAQTIYCIARTSDDLMSDATRPMYISTFTRPAAAGGGTTFGVSLSSSNPGSGSIFQLIASRGTSVSDDITGSVSLSTPTPINWSLTVGLVKNASTKNEIYNLTTNEHAISSAANTPRFPSLGFYRIGSSYSTTAYLGESDIAFIAIASVAHTEDQIKANAAALRAYFDPRSIFI